MSACLCSFVLPPSSCTETTHTQPPVTSRSTTTVADTSYGLPAVEALSISPLSSVDTEYFTHGGGAPSSSGNYSPAAPTSMPLFEGSAHQAFHAGRHRRNSSASSAGATPQSPAQWSPMPPQLATVRTNQSERGSFNTVATSPSPIARNVSTPPTGLSHFEAFTPAHDDGGHRRSPSTSSTGVGAWSPAVWSPAPQQRAVSRPQQRESGWTGPGWQESMPTVEFVSRRESFLPYGGIDRSARR